MGGGGDPTSSKLNKSIRSDHRYTKGPCAHLKQKGKKVRYSGSRDDICHSFVLYQESSTYIELVDPITIEQGPVFHAVSVGPLFGPWFCRADDLRPTTVRRDGRPPEVNVGHPRVKPALLQLF